MKARYINEKFTEDSDPIQDMGIGGISFEEEALKTIRRKNRPYNTDPRDEWFKFLNSLKGKRITGHFLEPDGRISFIIRNWVSYLAGTRLELKDIEEYNNVHHADFKKRYIIEDES